jgi:hypothetical protein
MHCSFFSGIFFAFPIALHVGFELVIFLPGDFFVNCFASWVWDCLLSLSCDVSFYNYNLVGMELDGVVYGQINVYSIQQMI